MKNNNLASYGIIFLFILSFCIVLAVYISTTSLMEFNMKTTEYNVEQRLMYAAEQLSHLVTADELDQYRDVQDMELESYQALRYKLLEFSERTNVLYAYYVRPGENGLLYYIVDNDFDEETRVGLDTEPYHIDTVPFMRQVLEGKTTSAGRGIYTPSWEGLLSIYAPVFNQNGEVTAIAGVDIDDAAIMRAWRTTKILAFVQIIIVVVVFLSGIIAFIRLRKTAEIAEKANRSKGDFLANMSHEIRTPMNAITGMAEMLLRGGLSDEMRCYAQDIKHAGNNLISIINDILDISKIEAGKLEIVSVNYTLSSLVNDTVNIIRARLTDKLIWFETEIDETIPNNLIGDEVRLRQIILNLLSNAVKYTDKGGINFSIKTEKIEEDKVWLKITVTDTGKGIRPEDQIKLFNNFVQVDKKKNMGIEGTGLGLAITKKLVDAMGGNISLQSEYEKGSSFTVIIPQSIHSMEPFGTLELVEKNYNEDSLAIRHSLSFARILVVDDLPVNLKVAEGLLSPYNAKVDCCLSGEEAIELVKQNKYNIIFMDHMMPGMDGMEATARIREFNERVPIIALTANAVVGMKDKFIQNGFNDFISKPIDVLKLNEILERWIVQSKGDKIQQTTVLDRVQEKRKEKSGAAEIVHQKHDDDLQFEEYKNRKQLNTNQKFILFSCILFLVISLASFTAYSFSARQINYSQIEQQLVIASETIRLHLATTVNSELALVRNLADAPIIRKYFLNPTDKELESLANAEFSLYEQHFKNKIIFWVNDIDKIFYTTGADPYIVEPDDPEKYWYNMTMYDTEHYNFNIDYDRHLQMVNLWVNAPVFAEIDGVRKSVGMLGTGIDLTEFAEFVSSGYREFDSKITPFMFNKFNEITSSLDYELATNKVLIDDHLGEAGKELLKAARILDDDRSISFIYGDNIYHLKYIPAMEWYLAVIHPLPGLLALNNAMNIIFFSMLFLMMLIFLVLNIFIYRSEKAIAEQNRQLIENRKIQAALQVKNDFLGKISHEIRTPINAITGMNELILRSDISEEARRYAQDIKQAGETLTSLVNDILNYSEGGPEKIKNIPADSPVASLFNEPQPEICIPGIDTVKGIYMTGKKIDRYKQVLAVLSKDAEERLHLLETVPNKENLHVFITQVHALKSALATVGAQELSEKSAALENAGRAEDFDFIREKLSEFTKQLMEMIKNINKVLEQEDKSQDNKDNLLSDAHRSLIIGLCAALEAEEIIEIDNILEQLSKQAVNSKLKAVLDEVNRFVLMPEYGEAKKTIDEYLANAK